ncbi:STAS domain-containing protein [Actinosynnema sp. NPDC023587]|uniref:STAS domain-containing protein n=1 Tax=Actinosynnema sp. NPDC023587 TaxID=3154695 RepID=UPI0033C278F6
MPTAHPPTTRMSAEMLGEVAVLRAVGEVDMSNSDELRDHGVRLLDGDAIALVLDLSGVTFFASSGIAALAHLHGHNRDNGTRPIHVAVGGNVRRTLELTAMQALLPLHDTAEQAIAAALADAADRAG